MRNKSDQRWLLIAGCCWVVGRTLQDLEDFVVLTQCRIFSSFDRYDISYRPVSVIVFSGFTLGPESHHFPTELLNNYFSD